MATKRFPILGTNESVPWSVGERAFRAYHKRFRHYDNAEMLAARGGFSPEELDEWAPGWRDERDPRTGCAPGCTCAEG